jgi:hypothetical protein
VPAPAEDEKEDVAPAAADHPMVVAAAAVGPIADEVLAPRPYMVPSLRQPIWSLGGEHSQLSLAGLVHDVIHVGQKAKITKAGMMMVFDLVRRCLPESNRVPQFSQAEESLLEACAVKAKEYVVCRCNVR